MLMENKKNNDIYDYDFDFEDILIELDEQYTDCLSEQDFYPPKDDRVLKSYIRDIDGGDNFADYCKDMFDLLEEEDYWD